MARTFISEQDFRGFFTARFSEPFDAFVALREAIKDETDAAAAADSADATYKAALALFDVDATGENARNVAAAAEKLAELRAVHADAAEMLRDAKTEAAPFLAQIRRFKDLTAADANPSELAHIALSGKVDAVLSDGHHRLRLVIPATAAIEIANAQIEGGLQPIFYIGGSVRFTCGKTLSL